MATTSLNILHLPFSKSLPSFPSRQLSHHLPLKSQFNNSNLLVCKAKNYCYNVEVVLEDDDPADMYLKHFEREVARAGIPQEWRRRRFYESEKEERERKRKDRFRLRSRRRRLAGARDRGGSSSGGGDYEVDEDDNSPGAIALARLLDPEYEEGNIEVLDEVDYTDEIWDDDGDGQFPVSI